MFSQNYKTTDGRTALDENRKEPDSEQATALKTFEKVHESKIAESEFSLKSSEPRYLRPLSKPQDVWHTALKPIKVNMDQIRIPTKNVEKKR